MADLGYGCVMHSTSMEEHYTFVEEHSIESTFQKFHVSACVFCNFRAVQNMKRYNLSAQMKRARNFDSITHLKRQNPTSRTEIRRTSLKYLFLETPCTLWLYMVKFHHHWLFCLFWHRILYLYYTPQLVYLVAVDTAIDKID